MKGNDMSRGLIKLSVGHNINLRRWPAGTPWRRTTLAELRAAERKVNKKLKSAGEA